MALARFGQSSLRLHQRFRRAASSRLTVTDPDGTARGVVTAYVTDWPAPQYTPPGGTAIPDTEWTLAATRSTVAAESTRTGLRVGRLVTDGVTTWGVVALSTALGVAEATLLLLRERVTIKRSTRSAPGQASAPATIATNVPVLIYELIAPESPLAAIGLSGGQDPHVGVCLASIDAQRGDQWVLGTQTFMVGRVISAGAVQVVKLSEATPK